jgi:hypothetical protein
MPMRPMHMESRFEKEKLAFSSAGEGRLPGSGRHREPQRFVIIDAAVDAPAVVCRLKPR